MVDWTANEAGTIHRAEASVRCSRFLRVAEILDYSDYALLTIFNVTDMDAYINKGLIQKAHILYEWRFISADHAKAYAERKYLQH